VRGFNTRLFEQGRRVDMIAKTAAARPDVALDAHHDSLRLAVASASFFAAPMTTRGNAPKAPLPLSRSNGFLPTLPFVKWRDICRLGEIDDRLHPVP
jgi:hypothetical protein